MAEEKEALLARWSRLKREGPVERNGKQDDPPALPPVESLTPESEFAPFMHPKVEDGLRRLALKKLFGDPHFNLPDPFEAYSGDWTGGEPIPEELLATLNQARSVLFAEQEKKVEGQPQRPQRQEAEQPDGEAKPDEPGRQDA